MTLIVSFTQILKESRYENNLPFVIDLKLSEIECFAFFR